MLKGTTQTFANSAEMLLINPLSLIFDGSLLIFLSWKHLSKVKLAAKTRLVIFGAFGVDK